MSWGRQQRDAIDASRMRTRQRHHKQHEHHSTCHKARCLRAEAVQQVA
eukprot:CAMPEP_0173096822 /NCGR_PEP_ID=MMETSP1102-20130122/33296_1 /TAXON_ID=49646 /ORGANISM="Geminigera sp., Strain Caron Lab Isolate" /LENGTH=47 /DNA_ID= /DNA_START= /DNA_END= /DNA_ORIENTATION=